MLKVVKKYLPEAMKAKARVVRREVKLITAKFHCPICDSRVVAFEPLPHFYLDNVEKYGFPFTSEEAETCNDKRYLCPTCQASDRDRLYALFIRDYLKNINPTKPIDFVDFAPSPPLSTFIRGQIAVSGAEISYRTADLFAENVDDRVNLMEMGLYRDNQFDFFICSHVLEHVADDRKALRELYRILKPGGRGILMVPIVLSLEEIDEDPSVVNESERWKRFGQFDHVRLYSKNGFLGRVKEAGFRIHQYDKHLFGEALFARAGIGSKSVLYVAQK